MIELGHFLLEEGDDPFVLGALGCNFILIEGLKLVDFSVKNLLDLACIIHVLVYRLFEIAYFALALT